MAKVYIADDEKNIRELIASFLREEGLEVTVFETGDQLMLRFLEEPADVIILDVMMPGTNGFETTRALRKRSDVPIILLTARDSDSDFRNGFSVGADDYFTKPFSPLQLTLRVKAILSRQLKSIEQNTQDELFMGNLMLSEKDHSVSYQNDPIKLTNTEFELLKVLMLHQGQAVSREDLLDIIWGYDSDVETRVTDDTIKRLRKKLRGVDCDVQIETVWGYGFKLCQKT